MTLVEFLTARLAEIEARHEVNWWNECDRCHDHAPCWALRDVEAKRRIVARAALVGAAAMPPADLARATEITDGRYRVLGEVLRDLASAYSDHPDYEEAVRS